MLVEPAHPGRCDPDDAAGLRVALAHHEALSAARETHLSDLRSEIRRLHERLDQSSELLNRLMQQSAAPPSPEALAVAPTGRIPTFTAPPTTEEPRWQPDARTPTRS